MKKTTEFTEFKSACLRFIRGQQEALKRTNSQVPATGKIWFWSAELQQVLTPKQFITWATEEFARNYHMAMKGSNKHLKKIFKEFAEFMVDKISSVKAITEEKIEEITLAIFPDNEASLSATQSIDMDDFEDDSDSKTPPLPLKASL